MHDDILAGLNPAQREAVTTVEGPVLVLAGPGSGKTRVLAHRVAYLLRAVAAHPRAIMAVTFTNKAAQEMRERINRLLGESVPTSTGWRGLTIGTFHSICARILRQEAPAARLSPNYVIFDDGEQLTAVKQTLRDLKLDEKLYRPEAMRSAISTAKNELIRPEQFQADTYWAEVARRVYTRYEELMAANAALDFDDLLCRTVYLFRDEPEVLRRYQERYRFTLVDEFQDTNTAQYELVRQLAGERHNLFVVGDEDQCVVAGTPIMTPGGMTPVESLRPGDRVMAAAGHGSVARGELDACPRRTYGGPVVSVSTLDGQKLTATPEHCVFARFPTNNRYHHDHVPQTTIRGGSVRKTVSLTMFGGDGVKHGGSRWHKPNDPWHLHELSICSSDPAFRGQIETVLPTRPHKQRYWVARRTHGDYDAMLETLGQLREATPDARIWQRARLTDHRYDFTPIGNLVPGAMVPVLGTDGQIVESEVVSVTKEHYEGLVYDLSVPNYRNYVAGGIVVHNSIYAFRGADYRNVMRFREDFPEAKVVLLEQNYRSTQTILDAANTIIGRNVHRTPKKLRTDRGHGLDVTVHEAYDESDEATYVVNTIRRLVGQGEAKLSDCAVMYRTNAQSRPLEDAFVSWGIPYRLVGGTRFYQRKEIKDALAYLRLVHNPADNLSLTRIINAPPRGIGEKTVSALASWSAGLGVSMAGGLALVAGDLQSPVLPAEIIARHSRPPERSSASAQDQPFGRAAQRALTTFYRGLAGWLAAKDGLTVAGLLDKIVEEAGYATWLRDGTEEGEDRWENLQELHSVAAHYDEFPPELRLTAFLEEVALVSDQDELAEESDRATLLTLHTAKGLEFPVVFMVGLEENILPHSRSKEDPDQLEEERRLMYVGVTRARDRLYLARAFRRTIWGRSEVNEPSRFLRDLQNAQRGMLRGEARAAQNAEPRTNENGQATRDDLRARDAGRSLPAMPSQLRQPQPAPRPPQPANRNMPAGDRQPQFKPGDRVDHGLFGQGIVLKSELTADDEEVTVAFAGKGTKTLLVGFAKLKKIS